MGWIVLAVIVVLIFWAISIYNGLVRLRNAFKNAFAQIDVQLKRRYDLIPNLVETVKGYIKHERETLEAVIQARNVAMAGLKVAEANPASAGAIQQLGTAETALTGALSRLREQPLVAALIQRDGHSAATRIAARLVELAWLLDALRGDAEPSQWVRAWPLGAGVGLAAVQTARGLLMHCARVSDDRVDDYRIVAPTEWNFHPGGALAHGLVGTEADDEATLVARAGLAVLALDPCVGFDVEVARHA